MVVGGEGGSFFFCGVVIGEYDPENTFTLLLQAALTELSGSLERDKEAIEDLVRMN